MEYFSDFDDEFNLDKNVDSSSEEQTSKEYSESDINLIKNASIPDVSINNVDLNDFQHLFTLPYDVISKGLTSYSSSQSALELGHIVARYEENEHESSIQMTPEEAEFFIEQLDSGLKDTKAMLSEHENLDNTSRIQMIISIAINALNFLAILSPSTYRKV
ncbi:hypothetical protein [Pleionea sp. CnH1-48]|uniref:hypothetical protein n=1 Tax=Pleionea sp. CnH1-48 TaxID=2954494 RepID=UPI00209692BE|nr:hypothetical protein [Pleionea sp. CnH1-48]MCO7227003.1 hypothetical protein [Pleionea sp. CnH1-48]